MSRERKLTRYRRWYRNLLRFYPRPYRERFAESMEQTFHDLCRERSTAGKSLLQFVLWMFLETSAGILRDNLRFIMTQNLARRLMVWAAVVALLLMVPFMAMHFRWQVRDPGSPALEEVNWSLFDFIFAGTVLFGAATMYELIASRGGTLAYRTAVAIACGAGLVLVWINAAVGIIGDEELANAMYLAVLAVALFGAYRARFQPRGMSRAMVVTALIQALVPVIALAWVPEERLSPGILPVMCLNAVFVAAWSVSALFFRHASSSPSETPEQDRTSATNRAGAAD